MIDYRLVNDRFVTTIKDVIVLVIPKSHSLRFTLLKCAICELVAVSTHVTVRVWAVTEIWTRHGICKHNVMTKWVSLQVNIPAIHPPAKPLGRAHMILSNYFTPSSCVIDACTWANYPIRNGRTKVTLPYLYLFYKRTVKLKLEFQTLVTLTSIC